MRWPLAAMSLAAAVLTGSGCGSAEAPTPRAGSEPAALQLCVPCHGADGRLAVSGQPRLAGQDEAYLLAQLRAYRDGDRRHAAMQAIVGSLRDDALVDLAAWFASRDPCGPPAP